MKIKEKVVNEAIEKYDIDRFEAGYIIDETLAEVVRKIRGYIEYRGGMGNRIDAWDVIDLIEGKKPEVDKFIEKTK